jgi:hypothetical protein
MEAMINSASQMQQQQIAMQTQVSLMKTSLNTQKAVGNAIISLIDAAAGASSASSPPQGKSLFSGKNLDITG